MTDKQFGNLKRFAREMCLYRGEYWCKGGAIGKNITAKKGVCRYLIKNKCTHPANPKNHRER